ncbi:hypothetical protein BGY98DRAFT_912704 [Russula aff. rugulosa BPL654]|nr:hypothetical protein BGY98DRAFT_912704 [Russula aff. rugulosa BPL654]
MLQSKLPGTDLALIWDLADLNNDGRLTRDGFAVAFHLIQGKLSGKEIPSTLPASLMPPSMRAVTAASTSPFQQPPSDPLNDSLWEDSPVTFQSQSAILQPERTGQTQSAAISDSHTQGQINFASNNSLLDEDDEDEDWPGASTTIDNHSAEIWNLRLLLLSTIRSIENTKTARSNVEVTTQNQAAQLSSLQTQLSSAKAAYENETRLLEMHRERFSDQASETQTINEQLGGAQLYLNAIRAESAEIDQKIGESLRKMTEIEKAKQETERQKGRLVVAKKRLATREAEKAKASQELQEAAAEAEEAAKEREIAEAALNKEATVINASNGLPFAPSP